MVSKKRPIYVLWYPKRGKFTLYGIQKEEIIDAASTNEKLANITFYKNFYFLDHFFDFVD